MMNNIKEIREKNSMTQETLAKLLSVRQSTVAMWENGSNMPRAEKLPKLADIFRCSIDDLLKN